MHQNLVFLTIIVHIMVITIHIILLLQLPKHIRIQLLAILDNFFLRENAFGFLNAPTAGVL
jgi:hypothetical protein